MTEGGIVLSLALLKLCLDSGLSVTAVAVSTIDTLRLEADGVPNGVGSGVAFGENSGLRMSMSLL